MIIRARVGIVVLLGALFVFAAAVSGGDVAVLPEVTNLTVNVSSQPIRDFPASFAVDGDLRTAPHWEGASRDDGFVSDSITYTFAFADIQTIDRVAFFQDDRYPALSYRIWAQDSAGTDVLLVEELSHNAPGSVYIEHTFPPVSTQEIRFEPVSGYGFRGRPYPRIADFRVNHPSDLVTSVGPLAAVVHLDTALSLNGFAAIHDSMFSVCEATWMGASNARQFLEHMNFGMYSHWPFHGWAEPPIIPEDPENPGRFDRSFVEDGRLAEWAAGGASSRIKVNDLVGGYANLGMITAPEYMRDTTSYRPTIFDWEPRQAGGNWVRMAPPEDFAEWGIWMGEIVRALNEETNGVIRDVYVWNEPNTHWYWPVPWDQKASWYVDFYIDAVTEFKELNPGVKVAGPVFSGAGVLARESASHNSFDQWIKPLLDSGLLDSLDVHNYSTHPQSLPAELGMVAAYADSQGIPMAPMLSSEGGYSGSIPGETVGGEWRYRALNWADLLLTGLDIPDLSYGQSYFFIYDSSPGFLRSRDSMEKTVMYWMYWAMRNLRGVRLATEVNVDDQEAVVMASFSDEQVTVFVRDRIGVDRDLVLSLPGIADVPVSSVTVDYVRFDGDLGEAVHGSRPLELDGERLLLPLDAYSLYAINIELEQVHQPQSVREKTTVRAPEINQVLSRRQPVTATVAVPADVEFSQAVLSFGIGGIPYHRMDMIDTYTPVRVSVNGESFVVNAAIYNEIVLDPDLVGQNNEIEFALLIPERGDAMAKTSNSIFLLSAGIDLWHTRSLEVPGGLRLFPDAFSAERMAPLAFDLIDPELGYTDMDPHSPVLQWQVAPFARSYQIIVARDKQFNDIVVDAFTAETSFTSEQLRHGETYYAKVRALSIVEQKLPAVGPPGFNAQNESFRWNNGGAVQLTTVAPLTEPEQVTDVTIAQGRNSVFVRWDKLPMVDEYWIYRRSPGEEWQAIGDVPGMRSVYEDLSVVPGNQYEYAVSAVNMHGLGNRSQGISFFYEGLKSVIDRFPNVNGVEGFADHWRRNGRWTLESNVAVLRAVFPQAFGSASAPAPSTAPVLHQIRFQMQEIANPSLAAIRLSTHMAGRDRYQLIYWVNEKRIELLQRTADGSVQHGQWHQELKLGDWYELALYVDQGVHEVYLNDRRIILSIAEESLPNGDLELYVSNLLFAVEHIEMLGTNQD